MKIAYKKHSFNKRSTELIELINGIVEDYAAQGYDLTLRQLYYQLVARDIIPNTGREYKNIGDLIGNARLAGLVSWQAIVDRTRNVDIPASWDRPGKIIHTAHSSYKRDLWEGQAHRVEVWVEKDALRGVVNSVCERENVPAFSCRGYTSLSEMWSAATRLNMHMDNGLTPVIIHLGDHDPSGMDMTRDIIERLEMFTVEKEGEAFHVIRAALNPDQVAQYNPPPNPAKLTDSRINGYAQEFGYSSWELDALEPAILNGVITRIIHTYRDEVMYLEQKTRQDREKGELRQLANNYQEAINYLNGDLYKRGLV